jgi:monofunctional glycosyltransferase
MGGGPHVRLILRASLWALAISASLFLVYQAYLFGHVWTLRSSHPVSTSFMDLEQQRLSRLDPPGVIRQHWVPYERISRYAKRAVVAAEDSGFTAHRGVEWEAIEQAFRTNRESGEIRFGGSTITMQLAKNLYLSPARSYWRKGQEILIAVMLESVLSKTRILELYLNLVEWGDGVFGIEAAARHYYGVSAAQINPWQAAWLASILPAPKRYDRDRQSQWIERKAGVILRRMPMVSLP